MLWQLCIFFFFFAFYDAVDWKNAICTNSHNYYGFSSGNPGKRAKTMKSF